MTAIAHVRCSMKMSWSNEIHRYSIYILLLCCLTLLFIPTHSTAQIEEVTMPVLGQPYRVINNWLHTKAPYTGSNPHITFLIHRYNLVDPAVGANPAPDVLATVGYLFGEWGTVGDVDGDTFDDLIIYEMLNIMNNLGKLVCIHIFYKSNMVHNLFYLKKIKSGLLFEDVFLLNLQSLWQ